MKTYKKLRSRQHHFYQNTRHQISKTNNTNSVKHTHYGGQTSKEDVFNHSSVIYPNNDLGEINKGLLYFHLNHKI